MFKKTAKHFSFFFYKTFIQSKEFPLSNDHPLSFKPSLLKKIFRSHTYYQIKGSSDCEGHCFQQINTFPICVNYTSSYSLQSWGCTNPYTIALDREIKTEPQRIDSQ